MNLTYQSFFLLKKRSLPTRAKLYLVIKLTIVDMVVGGFSHSSTYTLLMRHCEISALYPGTDINNWLSLPLVSSDLSYKHCSNFIRSDACNNSSLYSSFASPHYKVSLRGNNCCFCLGFTCNVYYTNPLESNV